MKRSENKIAVSLLALAAMLLASASHAGPREQAKQMHDRLVGVPPAAGVLDSMAASIGGGNPAAAAYQAMENPIFYTTSLRNFATPWTNVDRSLFAELNDYTATVIGLIRDDVPFDQVLSADLVYVGAPGVVGPGYSQTDNDHYRELEDERVDLSRTDLLVPVAQSNLPGSQLSTDDTAGVITTRAAGEAFFSAGTNRRMWRFIAINYMCRDMEELNDITRPPDRIRQDVSRSPGGDSSIFLNTCVGCHSGMDPMAGAFAYFEWNAEQERVVFTRGQVQEKYLINAATFPGGYATSDDRWDNYWRFGPNAGLGWGAVESGGFGPKSLGVEVANSRAFAECQVQKAFEHVCLRSPNSSEDVDEITRVANVYEAQNHSMKRVFAEVATHCMGE